MAITQDGYNAKHRQELVARSLIGLGLAFLSAILLTLAFPPYNLWPLIWIGFIPMLLAQYKVMPEKISSLALGVGVGGFFLGYFNDIFANSVWYMRYLPLLIAIIATLVGIGDRPFHKRTRFRWFLVQFPFLWVGIEMIRGIIPTFGTWGFVGYALYEQPWLIQPVSIFNIYGLDLLILLVNCAIAQGIMVLSDRNRGIVDSKRALISIGLLLIAWIVLSLVLLSSSQTELRVAAIQPGNTIRTQEGLDKLYDMTRKAAGEGAKLIVWHEGALPFDPQESHRADLQTLAADTGAHIVIGYVVHTKTGSRNEATLLAPNGKFLGTYGKDHPVAFVGETSLTRGTYPVYQTELGPLGIIICYDLDFTDTARKIVKNGARLITIPSHDWSAIASKHYSHLIFRAIENRVTMIKADVGYDSAIVDPYGRIIERAVTPGYDCAILVADVPLGKRNALSITLGDWIGWLSIICMGIFIIYMPLTVFLKKSRL